MVDSVRRGKIRTTVAEHRSATLRLRDQLVDVGAKDLLFAALHFLNDVEQIFLNKVDQGRSPAQEALWLDRAENVLQIAVKVLRDVNAMVDEYGGPQNVRTS